jgi:hypothetical protein
VVRRDNPRETPDEGDCHEERGPAPTSHQDGTRREIHDLPADPGGKESSSALNTGQRPKRAVHGGKGGAPFVLPFPLLT